MKTEILMAFVVVGALMSLPAESQIADPHQYGVQVETALPAGFGPTPEPVSAWLYAGSLDAVYVGRPCVYSDPGEPFYSQTHCSLVLLRRHEDAVRFRDLVSEHYPLRETRLVRVWATRDDR